MMAWVGSDTASQITSDHLVETHFNGKGSEYYLQNRAFLGTVSYRNMKWPYYS